MTAALITGSSRGIGAATARLFAERGIDVAVHYRRDVAAAEQVADSVRAAGRRAVVLRAELSNASEVGGVVDAAADLLGGLDIVVANAAASAFKPLLEMRAHHLRATFDTIVASYLQLVQAAAPHLAAAGPAGRVVAVSGFDTLRALPNHGLLAGAKAALEQFTRYLAVDLAPQGTTVNAVVPGFVDTDSARIYAESSFPGGFAAASAAWSAATPAGRLATATDIARVIALLCSADAAWITGQLIVADGGLTLR